MLPWLVEADKDSFAAEITASVPVVIDFWALLVLVRDGNEVDRLVGAVPGREIEAWLRRHVDIDAAAPA